MVAALFVAGALWAAPAATSQWQAPFPGLGTVNLNPIATVASAKEMASGSGSRVNKDPESLLRYGLPINNKEVSTDLYCTVLCVSCRMRYCTVLKTTTTTMYSRVQCDIVKLTTLQQHCIMFYILGSTIASHN
jgi:hypothetical protein